MLTPMFVEANGSYAIQLNKGGSSQPYHTSLIPATHPGVTPAVQSDVRYCSALTRDPVACVNQATARLPGAGPQWPTSVETTWTPSIREEYRQAPQGRPKARAPPNRRQKRPPPRQRQYYTRNPLRAWIGEYDLSHLLDAEGRPETPLYNW